MLSKLIVYLFLVVILFVVVNVSESEVIDKSGTSEYQGAHVNSAESVTLEVDKKNISDIMKEIDRQLRFKKKSWYGIYQVGINNILIQSDKPFLDILENIANDRKYKVSIIQHYMGISGDIGFTLEKGGYLFDLQTSYENAELLLSKFIGSKNKVQIFARDKDYVIISVFIQKKLIKNVSEVEAYIDKILIDVKGKYLIVGCSEVGKRFNVKAMTM